MYIAYETIVLPLNYTILNDSFISCTIYKNKNKNTIL